MILSDVSVKRPVFAAVLSLLMVTFGAISFERLSLREYPDIDPPVVTIDTRYPGASAEIVDNRITETIEDRVSGISGVRFISSQSSPGRSRVTIEFELGRDVSDAANDIRDRVGGLLDNLPDQAEPPEVEKADGDDSVMMWIHLVSDRHDLMDLTDYAERHLVDRFSAISGVARARVSGGKVPAMRIWLDKVAMAARGITAPDIEAALLRENIELPAGRIETPGRLIGMRLERSYKTVEDFQALVIREGADGHLVQLSDVARIERAPREERTLFRGNGVPMVGIGVVRQSQSNALEVAYKVRAEVERLRNGLPEAMDLKLSYDKTIFVEGAVKEVYKTLGIAIIFVIGVIYLFLGSVRAMIVPAVTVPVSLVATFTVIYALGFSINLLTLLALVLAIGLVVDDAIVVLENIVRRMKEEGEPPLRAAYLGARQVGFAVVATTLVLVSVFVPLAFLEGDVGRLFTEFALTMAVAVVFSSITALSLSAMLASKLLKPSSHSTMASRLVDNSFSRLQGAYQRGLDTSLRHPWVVLIVFVSLLGGTAALFNALPREYAPAEDRGIFFMSVKGPEGATYDYMKAYGDEIEERLTPLIENGDISRLLLRVPISFGNPESFNSAAAIVVLNDFDKRRDAFTIIEDVKARLHDLSGVRVFPSMRRAFGKRSSSPVQFVIGGGSYEELVVWRDMMLAAIADRDGLGVVDVDSDFKQTQPQIRIDIDKTRAGDLGVPIGDVGVTLETMLSGRIAGRFIENGEEYDVVIEGERAQRQSPADVTDIHVRSRNDGLLVPLDQLISFEEQATSNTLPRYNRVRAITITGDLAEGVPLGTALDNLDELAREILPEAASIDYKGESRDLRYDSGSLDFVLILGIVIVFLVLAAQFESFVHPLVIMLTVPLAIGGALLGIWLTGGSLNIQTQIGLVMLVGLAAKNGILIVEFANQLRGQGRAFDDAIREASLLRLRPIIMTGITTAIGAVPLILASGPGFEMRAAIGVTIFFGVVIATCLTIFVVPVAYKILARGTKSASAVADQLAGELSAPQGGGE
ncbi:MAG: efflux RND transporter permease subunit [Alphaproteobacteria bacterium]